MKYWIYIALFVSSLFCVCACADKNKDNSTNTAASEANKADKSVSKTANTTAKTSNNTTNNAADKKTTSSSVKPAKVERDAIDAKVIEASLAEVESALKSAKSGNVSAAIAALDRITTKDKKAFFAFYNLGILYERQFEMANARSAYINALSAEPKFAQALIQLVRIEIRNGNASSAVATADRYVTNHPDIFDLNYAKLEAMIANGQYQETLDLISVLLKKDEANPVLRYYLALTEFSKKRYRLAEFIIGESLEIVPDNPEALFLKARIHDALSEDDVALIPGIASTLDEVIKLNPDHLEALWMRANIYYEASNYQKAEEYYRHILELNPRTVGAMINLANTLKTLNRGPEAEEILKNAKTIDPYDGLVDFALGTLYLNIELIKLPSMKDMDRLKLARVQFENASQNWKSKEDIELAKGYIRTTDDAIETLQAMLDAEAFFNDSGSSNN